MLLGVKIIEVKLCSARVMPACRTARLLKHASKSRIPQPRPGRRSKRDVLRVVLSKAALAQGDAVSGESLNPLPSDPKPCPGRRSKRDVLRVVLSEAALAQGDAAGALAHARAAAARWPACAAAWNAYARAAASLGGLRHGLKYLAPLRARHPAALPLMLLTANAHTFTVRLNWLSMLCYWHLVQPSLP